MSDQAAYYADMLALEHRLDDTLRAAATRPLTRDEILDLRLACGIPARPVCRRPAASDSGIEKEIDLWLS